MAINQSLTTLPSQRMDRTRIMWFVTIGILLVSWKPMVDAAPSCPRVATMLAPCFGYINGQEPSRMCCSSVENLQKMGKTKDDRVAMCNCVKQVTRLINYDPKRITLLPKKCGVSLTFPPVDKNYDCSK